MRKLIGGVVLLSLAVYLMFGLAYGSFSLDRLYPIYEKEYAPFIDKFNAAFARSTQKNLDRIQQAFSDNEYAISIYGNGYQNVLTGTTNEVIVDFDTVDYQQPKGYIDLTLDTITIPVDGIYVITGYIQYDYLIKGSYARVYLRDNAYRATLATGLVGNVYNLQYGADPYSTSPIINFSGTDHFTAGTVLILSSSHNDATLGSRNIISRYIQITRLKDKL